MPARPQLAAQIIAADPFGYLVCMELAPSAVVRNVYPWGPNKQYDPIGHDLLYGAGQPSAGTTSTDGGPLPDVRALVVETIESGRTSLAGPFRLFNNSGGYVAFARHPVFISNVTSPDLTFNRPSQPTNCPAACYDADARRLFWGLAIAIVDFDALSYKIFTMLEVDGYYYRMTRPADSSFDPAGGPAVVDIVASAAGGVLDPVQAAVRIPGGEWQLYLSPVGGWRPGWARGLSALVVLVSLVVDLLLLHLLVYFVRRRLLLLAIIPPKALALVSRGRPFVEHFGCVTVLFSDIVSYTSIAAEMSPLQVVRMLDDLYSIFDVLCEKHGLYKVRLVD